MRTIRPTKASLAISLLALALGVVPASGAATPLLQFQSPSGYVRCAYAPAPLGFLRCDARKVYRPAPPAPPGCRAAQLNWADSFRLRTSGRASAYCHGDTSFVAEPAPVLRYGATWRHAGITCRSARVTGISCANASGHGFSLMRTRWRLF